MRKLFWFTVGFLIACGLCGYWLYDGSLLLPALILLAAGAACAFMGRERTAAAVLCALLFGGGMGFAWFFGYSALYLRPISQLDGETLPLRLTASGYSERTRYSIAVDGTILWEGKTYQVLAYLDDEVSLEPGDVLESAFRLRLTTPNGLKESSYYQGDGVFLIATQKGETRIIHPENPDFWHIPVKFAKNVKKTLEKYFPKDTAAFAKALLLGDTSGLSYREDTALKLSGIRHIAAVSGLHVSVIYGLLLLLFGSHRFLTPLISIPVLLFFCAMTGFSPSVVRACLMIGLMILGSMLFREYDTLTSLAFACLLMLAANPYVVKSVGFQLSFASVGGILFFASPIYQKIKGLFPLEKGDWRNRPVNWVAASVSVSTSAVLLTTPLSACYFGTVSLIGVLTNLLTIWVVSILFCGIAVVAVVGNLLPKLGAAIAWALSWLIRYVLGVAKLLAGIPFAAVYTQSRYIVLWLIASYVLFVVYLLRQKRLRIYCTVCALGLCAAIGASVLLPRLDDFRLTVIDVGEGQSLLLESGGKTLLIDCGGDSDVNAANAIAQTLLSQGITRLDAVTLTHYDQDHSGALENVLTRIGVDTFYLPAMEDEGLPEGISLPGQIVSIDRKTTIPFGEGTLTFTEPGKWKSDNENCMCILFESEKCDILVTGDRSVTGEKRLLQELGSVDVDILIAGHHGSKNSTSYELLQAVTPETVIISVGKNNSYGHPAQQTLDRLTEFGCTVYRTDRDGSVLARR